MSNSIVYKIEQIGDYAFDSVDCFICAAHDDERSTEGISKMLASGVQIEHAIIIKYDNGSHSTALNELFEGRAQEISVSNDVNSFILQFKKTVKPYINKNIVIDISCVRIPDMFSIMKILKLNDHIKHIPCIYSVPYDYEYFAGDFSYKSSLGDLQNYELAGYGGEYNPDNPNSVYVIFLGFEGALSLKVLEEAVYKNLMFVNSLPSLSQKYKDISILNNRSSIKGKKYDSILYAPADNPFEVYNFLEKNYADEPSICISPLATKPVALGVCLFALNYEKVRIVYPISDIYSSHVTNQVTKTLVYEISLTQ